MSQEDAKQYGGRWDPNVSFVGETLQKDYGPMLPAVKELKDSLVSVSDKKTVVQC